MGTPRFTPEFKEGVSTLGLYKWFKCQRRIIASCMTVHESLKMMTHMRQTKEGRDILKGHSVLCKGSRVK